MTTTAEKVRTITPSNRPDLRILVDADRYYELSQFKWCIITVTGGKTYACRSVRENGRMRTIYLHRVVNGTPEGHSTDHKNNDTLDNRADNLRTSTATLQNANRRKFKTFRGGTPTSLYKGVSKSKRGFFVARLRKKGKQRSLGNFTSEIEAALAYDDAAHKEFGEFARLNFPLRVVESIRK